MYLNKNKKARNYQNGGDVPSEKAEDYNWMQDPTYTKLYDFASDPNLNRNLITPGQISKHSGRDKLFHRFLIDPATTGFSTDNEALKKLTGKQNVKGNIEVSHPRSLTKDILDLDEEQLSYLLGRQWKYPSFEHGTSAGGATMVEKNLSKKYNSKTGKSKRHEEQVAEINEVTGLNLKPGHEAYLFMKMMATDGMLDDAIAAKFPSLDPGSKRGAYRKRHGRTDAEGGMGQDFINAPLSYVYNLEASGKNPRSPGEDWLEVQHTFQESGNDAVLMRENLRGNSELMQKISSGAGNIGRSLDYDLFKDPKTGKLIPGSEIFSRGVNPRKDEKGNFKGYFSDDANRFLTEAETNAYLGALTNDFIKSSGWKEAGVTSPGTKGMPSSVTPTGGTMETNQLTDPGPKPSEFTTLTSKTISEVPSGKGTDVITNTGVMPTFTDETQGSVSVDLDELKALNQAPSGTGTGTGGEDVKVINEAREKKLSDQSTSAVVNSYKSGKHIKTGEGYGDADLQRDADIIKKKFGDKAYQNLMAQLTSSPGDPSSDVSAVTTNLNKRGGSSVSDNNVVTQGYDVVNLNELRESIGGKEVEEGEETDSRSREVMTEMDEPEETQTTGQASSTTYGGDEINTFFPMDYQNLGYYGGMGGSTSSPFKAGGKLNKYNKGGEVVKGFYDEGGNLVKGFYAQGGMNYRVPQIYKRGDASLGNPIGQLKAEIDHYKTVYDPNNPAQVAKLDEMEARLDKMTLYKVERTNILDTTDANTGVDVETETQE